MNIIMNEMNKIWKSKVTSIDEESSIDRFGYEEFSNLRYSKESIDQSSAVPCSMAVNFALFSDIAKL